MMQQAGFFDSFSGGFKKLTKGIGGFWALEATLEAIINGISNLAEWANLKEHAETLLYIFFIASCVFIFGILARFTGAKGSAKMVIGAGIVGFIFWMQGIDNNIFKNIYAYVHDHMLYIMNVSTNDAVASTLFWLFFALVGFVVFFGTFASFLGLKKETQGVSKVIYWSLPISFFLLFFYTSIKINQNSQDVLYDIIRTENIKNDDQWQIEKNARNIDHVAQQKKDKDYLTKAVKSFHSQFLYNDMARSLGKRGILQGNNSGEDALLTAVKIGNLEALKAFKKHVSFNQKYMYGWFFKKEEMSLHEIAKKEGHEDVAKFLNGEED